MSLGTKARFWVPAAVALLVVAGVAAQVAGSGVRSDFTETATTSSTSGNVVIVRLQGAPVASAEGIPRSEEDGQVLLESAEAQAHAAQLEGQQSAFISYLQAAAPQARVIRRWQVVYNGVAVELNGADPAVITAGPNVAAVAPARTFQPTMNVSGGVINAQALWSQVGGTNRAGAGIKVGIIDSGIDSRHPFLTDPNLAMPRGFPKCDFTENCALTTAKVIVAREYPKSDAWTADDANGHGTHVSGTVAGVSGTTAPFAQTPLSGVAPKAYLGNYNVFPGNTESASEFDIIDALEDAVKDGMNVLNMSLGGDPPPPPIEDPLADAVNATADAGLVVAVAAGNSGPGAETIDSPGVAEKALTVGAVTNPHFIGLIVTSPAGSMGAAAGQFNAYDPPLSAALAASGPGVQGEQCEPTLDPTFRGKIVLVRRGGCNFTLKVRNAELAGAVGVLMQNNVAGDPVAMGHDGTEPAPRIPAVMISKVDGEALRAHLGATVSVDGTQQAEFLTQNVDIMAGFSSRGPTPYSFRIKPDVTAPGVNVYSSIPGGGYAMFQGTSMATPHVAGAAALLRQNNKRWTPQQVKSALSSTAQRPVFDHVNGTSAVTVMHRGTGRIDLGAAGKAALSFSPSNVGFGKQLATFTASRTVTVTNNTNKKQTVSIAVSPIRGSISVTLSTTTLQLGGGQSASVTVRASGTTLGGEHEGDLVFTVGGQAHRVPYWVSTNP